MIIKSLMYGGFPFYALHAPEGEGGGGSGGGEGGAAAGGEGAASGAGEGQGGTGNEGGAAGGEGSGQGQGAAAGGEGQGAAGAGNEGDAGKRAKPPVFGEGWREALAVDKEGKADDKGLKMLKRFNSPADLYKSYNELQAKISSGEYKKPLGKDATPEQIAEHRKENGIPEKAADYLKELPEGLVFGEEDKAVLEPFINDLHEMNASPALVQRVLQAYHQSNTHGAEQIQARDIEIAQATEDSLREEWGADYRPNVAAVHAFIDSNFPAELKGALHNARLGDEKGTPLLHHPDILRSFASLGRLLNPQSTVVTKGMDNMDSINAQIAELEGQMGNKHSKYWKEPAEQERYRNLISTREKYQSMNK